MSKSIAMSIRFPKYFLATVLVFIFSTVRITAQDLSKLHWKNRILIVNFDAFDQKNYEDQMRDLKSNLDGLIERKLVIYQIHSNTYKVGFNEKSKWQKISHNDLRSLKKKSETGFLVTLIGLDGGIKKQQSTVLSTTELFKIIDIMPMRVRELKRKNK